MEKIAEPIQRLLSYAPGIAAAYGLTTKDLITLMYGLIGILAQVAFFWHTSRVRCRLERERCKAEKERVELIRALLNRQGNTDITVDEMNDALR